MNIIPPQKEHGKSATEKGSALVYILIAIALLAALTLTFMEPSSQQTSSQNSFKTISEVESQIGLIRSAIQECVLYYDQGDPLITGEVTEANANTRYPINPNSAYLDAGDRSGNRLVRNLRCPGNNPGTGSENQHGLLFASSTGKFMPPAPNFFDEWEYYNGEDGVFFWTGTDKSDPFLASALAKIDDNYAECEVDVIDTSVAPAGAKDLDSGPTAGVDCDASHICLRVWLRIGASALYPGDADGDENTDNLPTQADCP